MQTPKLCFILLTVFFVSVIPSVFAEHTHVYHYTKGKVDQNSPFTGEVVWTLIDGSSGTLVHSSPTGVVVIRFDLSYGNECINKVGAVCLDAKITSVISGPLEGSSILINMEKYRIPEPEKIAKKFVISSPTFAYDGMKDSLDIKIISVMESFPEQYLISAEFTSRHGGYGDRTDQIVTQVLTDHSMELLISNGSVQSAIIDDKWDEIKQKPVE